MKNEWSLIFFTLLMQTAIGAFIVLLGLNTSLFFDVDSGLSVKLTHKILYIIMTLSIVALISSFLHLGKPKNTIFSFNNLGSSWLSREIFFIVLFMGFMFGYTFLEITLIATYNIKMVLALSAILFGILAVFSMAKIYMLEIVPAWNSINTTIQFYSATAILGTISVSLIILIYSPSSLEVLSSIGTYDILLLVIFLFVIVDLVSFLVKLRSLAGGSKVELESLNQIRSQNLIVFYLRILLSVTSILIIFYQLIISGNSFSYIPHILLSVAIILSEIAGRYLFYVSYNRIGI